jgi:hypothetical protein
MCFSDSQGSTMCPAGEPTTTMMAQLIVGLVGVVPAPVIVFFAFRDAKRLVVAALVVGLALWTGASDPLIPRSSGVAPRRSSFPWRVSRTLWGAFVVSVGVLEARDRRAARRLARQEQDED